jgi:hypothetical protein
MSIFLLMLAFICYALGGNISRSWREVYRPSGGGFFWAVLIELPFGLAAYFIVASQVSLHV